MSSYLGSLTITANTKTSFSAPNEGVKAILIGNESGLTVTITMESGGVQKTLYPSTVDWFQVKSGFSGNILINPTVILNNTSSWPSSSLVFDAIGLQDHENVSMYPFALPRNTNIGNSVSTSVTATNSISNTGNAPLSNWLTVTPNDAVSPTFSGDTSGNLTVKSDNAGVLTTLLQLIAGASPAVKIAAAAIVAEVLGGLKVDGTFESVGAATLDSTLGVTGLATLSGGAKTNTISDGTNGNAAMDLSAGTGDVSFNHHLVMPNNVTLQGKNTTGTAKDLLVVDTSNVTRIVAASTGVANEIAFFDSGGTQLGWFDGGGAGCSTGQFSAANGGVKFNSGSISKFTNFSGTGSGTVATGIGATPTCIAFDPCTVSGSSQTIGGSLAASSVVTVGSALAWKGIAYLT